MLNNNSIITIVFSQPTDPTPQPTQFDNILQVWVTDSQEVAVADSESEQLPQFKLDLDLAREA